MQSLFLWFRACNRKLGKLKQSKSAKLAVENGLEIIAESIVKDKLKQCDSVS